MKLTKEQAKKKYKGVTFIGDYFYIAKGAIIHKGAIIYEGATIYEGAIICEGAVIYKGAIIHEGAMIGRYRKKIKHNIVIHGIGTTKIITGFTCDDGIIITIGCLNDYKGDTPNKVKKEIAKKYKKTHEYFDAVNLIVKFLKKKLREDKK